MWEYSNRRKERKRKIIFVKYIVNNYLKHEVDYAKRAVNFT